MNTDNKFASITLFISTIVLAGLSFFLGFYMSSRMPRMNHTSQKHVEYEVMKEIRYITAIDSLTVETEMLQSDWEYAIDELDAKSDSIKFIINDYVDCWNKADSLQEVINKLLPKE